MRRPWFKLEECGADFLDSAPQRQVGVFTIPQPAGRVWEALTADDTLSFRPCAKLRRGELTRDNPPRP